MPEMDGYQLAQHVRLQEAQEKRARTPIIAWTANTIAAQRKHCLTSGMDDLLTKPVDLSQLSAMLQRWLPVQTDVTQRTQIDFHALRDLSDDPAVQRELLQEFQLQNRLDVADLNAALHAGNSGAIRRQAHRIKGASRMVGARALSQLCADLESKASQQQAIDAAATSAALERIMRALEHAIHNHCGSH